MLHYERVQTALDQAERALQTASRSEIDSEAEKAALKEALEMVRQANEKCRTAQMNSVKEMISSCMKMQ
nr:hypothetical protein [uncultured Eisenbergiella sp.]